MNILGLWILIVAEIFTSASVRIKENKADKQFANAEYDKALEVYIDLAKAYENKMKKNEKKYPTELVKGKNHKYTEYK